MNKYLDPTLAGEGANWDQRHDTSVGSSLSQCAACVHEDTTAALEGAERAREAWISAVTRSAEGAPVAVTMPGRPMTVELHEWLPGYWSVNVGPTDIVHIHLEDDGRIGVRRVLGDNVYDSLTVYGRREEDQ